MTEHHDTNRVGLPPQHRIYRRRKFLESVVPLDGVDESQAAAFAEARTAMTIQRENRKGK